MWCSAEITEDITPIRKRKRHGVKLTIFIPDDQLERTPIEKLEEGVARMARQPLTRRMSQLMEKANKTD